MNNTEPGADICARFKKSANIFPNFCRRTDGSNYIRVEYSLVIFFLEHIKVNVLGIRGIYIVKIVNIRQFYNTYCIYLFIQLSFC